MTVAATQWDAIVIGSGIGGLCTAAYLSTNGKRVLVLEAQSVIGGAAQSFHRRRVFEFNTGAHYVGDCTPDAVIPTALRGVGLEGEVAFNRMDPDEFDRIVAPGVDFDFRVPRGWDAFEERLAQHFPSEEEALRTVVRKLRRMGEAMEQIGAPPRPTMRVLMKNARALPALRDGVMSLQRLFDRHHLSEGARAALGYISNFVLLPREDLAAAIYAYGLHHYVKTGGWYINGSVSKLSHTLARLVRCHGGEIRLRSRVQQVLVDRQRTYGVRLATGEEIYAPVVVSNADIKTTYGGLVPAEHLSARRVRRFANAGLSGCGFSVYLGVDIDLREYLPSQNIFDIGSLDYQEMLDMMFRSSRDDFDPDKALLWITSGTLKDDPAPGSAGYSSLELTTLTPQNYAFWGVEGGVLDGVEYHRDPAYLEQKQRIEDALVRRTLEILPFLEGHIVWQESSTMLSHEDWTLSRFGAWAGLDFSLKNMLLRPGPRTEIKGLFLTGASSSCGGAILGTLRGGVETAGAILDRSLWDEVSRGAVFGHGLTDKGFATPPDAAAGSRDHQLRVSGIERHTADSVLVEFDVPRALADTFAHQPGQYLTVRGEAAGEEIRRSYSICEPPSSGRLRIGIKAVHGGVFSTHALNTLKVGDVVRVAPPRGSFGASPSAGRPRTLAAIAAGSGITPIMAILSSVLDAEPDTACTLIYGNQTVDSTMFREDLEKLHTRYGTRMRIEHHLSRQSLPDRPGFHQGRVDADALKRHFANGCNPDDIDEWLLCGPADMVETAIRVLDGHGVDESRVKAELFDTGVGIPAPPSSIPADAIASIQLNANERATEFTMKSANETILDAAIRQRDDLPYSCFSGTCGSCRAKVCDGTVEMLDVPHMALEESEASNNFVLTCLSHPVSERVVVDFDAAVG
jgi:all-trans-retinol 13,14-reductase